MVKSKRKKKSGATPALIITKGRREHILALAEALAVIAPSTSRGKFSVQHVAQGMSLKKCWKKQSNKKKDIAHLLENVCRKHPRKPKALVLAIVRGGVVWLARKGERVMPEQLDAIAVPMEALGFSIRKELSAIPIPEPSRVRDPSEDKVAVLASLLLHESLTDDCAEMFKDGHFNEAVRKGLERFEARVQKETSETSIGKTLMGKVFNPQSPLIAINDGTSGNDPSEQEGFMHLTMGAMAGMRNIYSHGDTEQMNAIAAIERLAFISLLFRRVDTAVAAAGTAASTE